jgi:alpha/beta superfamily hydrolase
METPEYIRSNGVLLYTVYHSHRSPSGSVLMIGPFGLERTHAYRGWVRVARSLCERGFDVLRFDHRGSGESMGAFEDASFDVWTADAERCFDVLAERSACPIALFGLRAGTLIASRVFRKRGDALLAWEPPASGRAHLLEILRRKLASDYAENARAVRKTREDYVRDLESGSVVEVEGYPWTKKFWESALTMEPPVDRANVRTIRLEGSLRLWIDNMVLEPDIGGLVTTSVDWLRSVLATTSDRWTPAVCSRSM